MAKNTSKAPAAPAAVPTGHPDTPTGKAPAKAGATKPVAAVSDPAAEKKAPAAKAEGKYDALAVQAMKSFSAWTSKIDELKGLTKEQVYDKFYTPVLVEQEKKFPKIQPVEHHKRALRWFKLHYKQKSVGAGRVKVQGIFYAFRGKIDQVAKRRGDILKEALINPKKAAKEGTIMTEQKVVDGVKKTKIIQDEEGHYIPRDNKQFYDNFKDKQGNAVKNPRFGKPLPDHQWNTTYFGLFSIDDDDPQLAFFQMRGADGLPENCPVPMNVPVSFYAYSTSDDKGTGLKVINGFKTKFTIEPELNIPTMWQAFESGLFSAQQKTLSDLNDWCAANGKNFNAFFVADVNVLSKMEEKNNNGTYLINVDDDSLGFADENEAGEKGYASLTCFVAGAMEPVYKTFAELSRVIIIAAARRDFKKDDNQKVMTNSKGEKVLDDPVISVWGLDVDPEFIEKPRDVEDADEADLSKAAGKSAHADIDDEVDTKDLKPSKVDEIDEDDDDDDDDEVEKPKAAEDDDDDDVDSEDDDADEPEGGAGAKVKGEAKPKAADPTDDDIDEILDSDVDKASE